MKTITKLIYTSFLVLFFFSTINIEVFATVGGSSGAAQGDSSVVHRDSLLPPKDNSTASSVADPMPSADSMPSSSMEDVSSGESVSSSGSESPFSSNGEYAIYLGMKQELPNQTPKPTPTPTPTPEPVSSVDEISSEAIDANAKPEKIKPPPTCNLCHSCNGILGVCLYVWIGFVIIILLCVLTLLIVMLNVGNAPKGKKEKKPSKIHLPKIKLALPKLALPSFSKKNELKIIKTKVKRSNKAQKFTIGNSRAFSRGKKVAPLPTAKKVVPTATAESKPDDTPPAE